MDKFNYLVRTFSRTNRKDWENYVLNAIWNRLGNLSIKPVSQQYINRRDAKDGYYLIDLYFPQLNIGVECDEGHHLRCQGDDKKREIEITDVLRRIQESQDGKDAYRAIHIEITKGDVERQIDDCVAEIKAAVEQSKSEGRFLEWTSSPSPQEYYRDKTEVTVSDGVGFKKIVDVCNTIFGTDYKGRQGVYFKPWTIRERYEDDYIAWFPKLAIDGKAATRQGWNNQISLNGKEIYDYNENWKEVPLSHDHINPAKRIVFARTRDPITREATYRFFGVFKTSGITDDGKRIVHTKVEDSFPIVQKCLSISRN
jgi:very-short-patch-repair endonuclease